MEEEPLSKKTMIAAYVLHLTRFGRTVCAVGGSESSARLMGLDTARIGIVVYAIGSVIGGQLLAFVTLQRFLLRGQP